MIGSGGGVVGNFRKALLEVLEGWPETSMTRQSLHKDLGKNIQI